MRALRNQLPFSVSTAHLCMGDKSLCILLQKHIIQTFQTEEVLEQKIDLHTFFFFTACICILHKFKSRWPVKDPLK